MSSIHGLKKQITLNSEVVVINLSEGFVSNFERNLKKLSDLLPGLAEELSSREVKELQWSKSKQNENNLLFHHRGREFHLHSQYNIARETEKWLSGLDLNNSKVIYIYGLGLAYSYAYLKEWLHSKPDHYLVILEDEQEVWLRWLETELASEMLDDQQIVLADISTRPEECEIVCYNLAFYFVQLSFRVTALPHYQLHKPKMFQQIQMFLRHRSAFVNYSAMEFLSYGSIFFKNFYNNCLQLPNCHEGKGLLGAFKGVPAIVCGAGPSLNKNLSVLKDLEDRALIFAGGSAINALTSQGIMPHFGASVDPNREQYVRMSSHSGYELPTFVISRVNHEAFNSLHGPRIYLSDSSGYPICNWLDEQLGIEGFPVTQGCNVLHFMMDLARQFGCDPIIFVGMDLAYTGLQLYASDVVDTTQVSKETITKGGDLNTNAFMRRDIFGEPIHTLWKWVAESEYTSTYAEEHKENTFINATEGGLGAQGVLNTTLKEVAEDYLTRQYDLRGWVHRLVQEGRLDHVSTESVMKTYATIEASLNKVRKQCEDVSKRFSNLKTALDKGDSLLVRQISKKIEKTKEEMEENFAYEEILNPVNRIRSVLYERQFNEIERDSKYVSELDRVKSTCDSNLEEIENMKEAATVNLMCLQKSVEIFQAMGKNTDAFFNARESVK